MNKLNEKLNGMSPREKGLVALFALLALVVLGYSGVLSNPVRVIRTYPALISDMQSRLDWNTKQIQNREQRAAALASLEQHVREREACFPQTMDIESVITDFRRFAQDAGIVMQNIRPHRAAPLRMEFLSNLSPQELGAIMDRGEPVPSDDIPDLIQSHFGATMPDTLLYYVEMSLKGNYAQLLRFIEILEHYDRFVTINRLQMSAIDASNTLSVKMDLHFINYSRHEPGPASTGACANVDQAMLDRIKKKMAPPNTQYGKADPFAADTQPAPDIYFDFPADTAPPDNFAETTPRTGGDLYRDDAYRAYVPNVSAPQDNAPDIKGTIPEFDINGIIMVQGRPMISVAGYDQMFAQGQVIDGFAIQSIDSHTILLEKNGRKVRYEIR